MICATWEFDARKLIRVCPIIKAVWNEGEIGKYCDSHFLIISGFSSKRFSNFDEETLS